MTIHLARALLLLGLAAAFTRPAAGGPAVPCTGSPDPLRFRAELPVAAATAPAVAADVDEADGTEHVALAYLTGDGEVVVTVSSDGACSFGADSGGLDPTVVAGPGITERPAVAVRVQGGAPTLAVAWAAAGRAWVRLASAFDGTFSDPVDLGDVVAGGPALASVPPGRGASIGVAWLGDDGGTAAGYFRSHAVGGDPADWGTPRAVLPGAGTHLVLIADVAGGGAGAFTLWTDGPGGPVAVRSDDEGQSFGVPTAIDAGRHDRPTSLAAGAATDPSDPDAAWQALAWRAVSTAGPRPVELVADAARTLSGSVDHDFDGAGGGASPVLVSPADGVADPAVAVGSRPGGSAAGVHVAWTEGGELFATRRELVAGRPVIGAGCGPFVLTGLDPPRAAGSASAPAAAALGEDVLLAFVDDRSGSPTAWVKRADSRPPPAVIDEAVPAPCGDPPGVQLSFAAPPCDVVSQVIEVGLSPGATDFTVDAGLGAGVLVDDLQPGTTHHFRLRSVDAAGNETVSEEVAATTETCSDAHLVARLTGIVDACPFGGAGGDGAADPGEPLVVRLTLENVGTADAPEATLQVASRDPRAHVRTGAIDVGDVAAGTSVDADVEVDVSATAACADVLRLSAVSESAAEGAAWNDAVELEIAPACTPCDSGACAVTADASLSVPVEICNGQTATLDGGASGAENCAGVLLYEWSRNGNVVGTTERLNRSPNGDRRFDLRVRCSTDLACEGTTAFELTVHPLPGVTVTEDPPPPHCDGDTVSLTASTSDPAATYEWDDGATSPAIEVTASSVRSVTVTDSNGCSRTRSVRIELGVLPDADAGPDRVGCGPQEIGTPGFPLLDYSWEPADGLSAPDQPRTLADPASPTTYTLTVTDPTTGCSATDTVRVEARPLPGAVAGLSLSSEGGLLTASWTAAPDAATVRLYREGDVRVARQASSRSATALLTCEGSGTCTGALPPGDVYFQAVGACVDGGEGPN